MPPDATPLDPSVVADALAGVRELVAADGGNIELTRLDGSTVHLDLILEGAECRECVMPRQFLEQVALDMMKPLLPALTTIVIHDPRDA